MKYSRIETKKNILRKSYRLFLIENLDKATINDIENATNRTRGAIFYYFKDKQSLFEKTVEHLYFSSLKKSDCLTNTSIDFEYFIENYQSPAERVIAQIKEIDETINAEKAFYHFTLQASRYYPNFDTIYNKFLINEYEQIISILSQYHLKIDVNVIACLLINNDCCNTFNTSSAFNIRNKQILKLLLQR